MLTVEGDGLVNSLINKLPFELHLPAGLTKRYNYCGPGTKLEKRLARGDRGINPLDEACRDHDIAYSTSPSLTQRHQADERLENRAWERVKSKDASFGEKAAAWAVTNTMKVKRKMGMGVKKRSRRVKKRAGRVKKRCHRGGALSFKQHVLLPILKSVQKSLEGKGLLEKRKDLRQPSLIAIRAARAAIKKAGGRKKIRVPRLIPFPSKVGGLLPLIPIFAGLSALGSLAGGASAIAKTVMDAKAAKRKLEEDRRHNAAMEEIGKKGAGLYLRKTSKGGYGLFLKKQKNSH